MHARKVRSGHGRCPWLLLALAAALAVVAPALAASKSTFAIDYIVTIAAKDPRRALVRWELSGIDEIEDFRLRFPAERFEGFAGSGTLEHAPGSIRWVPGGPYAHLSYQVRIDHQRGRQQRHDSYAGTDWVITRARDLFPRILLNYTPRGKQAPKSRARLIFRLPAGWRSAAAHEAIGTNIYLLIEPGKVLDRPRGWIALGNLEMERQEIAGIMLQAARVPGGTVPLAELLRFYDRTLPVARKLFPEAPERILIVSAGDPMWRGGISGAGSFFIHAGRPLRTADKTSPYLHELFHVLQPYRAAADADWIEEGLAEYYALELQRRSGLLDATGFGRGLDYFQRYGLWQVDMTKQYDNRATNNSAPLLMYDLDQRIQRATAGSRRLDDVVMELARNRTTVDTTKFRRVVESISGKKFGVFFRRHVLEGNPPARDIRAQEVNRR
ncbi:MAG: hypothetical protein HY699_14555 [Deltaproteobacteria bacterium]|nr:hypothetical protein [Deltaproteobacteria bacterium]